MEVEENRALVQSGSFKLSNDTCYFYHNKFRLLSMLLKQLTKRLNIFKTHYLFARKVNRPKQPEIEANPNNNIKIEEIDYDNFDYFTTLPAQQKKPAFKDRAFAQKIKKLYLDANDQCLSLLRERQQQLIHKICNKQEKYEQLRSLLSLKITVNFRFRNWDNMAVDIQNSIQSLKYQKQKLQKAEEQTIPLYNQLCAIYIMNDHNKLYKLLEKSPKQQYVERKRKIQTKTATKPFGLDQFEYIDEKIEQLDSFNQQLDQLCSVYLLKAAGLFVVGKRQEALKISSQLLSLKYSAQIREKAFILILTSLSLATKQAKQLPEQLWNKLLIFQQLTDAEIKQLSTGLISAQQCQHAVRWLSRKTHGKQLQKLSSDLFQPYERLLYLICQNYYFQGKEQQFQRVLSSLKGRNRQTINILLRYLEIGINIDTQNYQKAIQIYQQATQQDQMITEEGRTFYLSELVCFDILRVNILRMALTLYESQNNDDKVQQLANEIQIMPCTLGVFTVREPKEEDMWQDDWRKTAKGRIPIYYLNLNLESIFHFE